VKERTCKWWWKVENEEGLWQEIVRKKYNIKGGIVNLRKNLAIPLCGMI
jgi:hypothetical protein